MVAMFFIKDMLTGKHLVDRAPRKPPIQAHRELPVATGAAVDSEDLLEGRSGKEHHAMRLDHPVEPVCKPVRLC
jgi:hypothetical protein